MIEKEQLRSVIDQQRVDIRTGVPCVANNGKTRQFVEKNEVIGSIPITIAFIDTVSAILLGRFAVRMLGWATAIALVAMAAGIGARDARATLIFKLESVLEEALSTDTEASAVESESNTEGGFEFMCSLEKHDGEGEGGDGERGMLAGIPAGGESVAASFGQSLLSGPKFAGPKGRGGSQGGQGSQGGGSNGTGPGSSGSFSSRGPSVASGPPGGGPPGGGPPGGGPPGGGPPGGGPPGGDPPGGDPPGIGDPGDDIDPPTGPLADPVAASVPEPSTLVMGGLASLIGLGLARVRRSKKS